MEELDQTKLFVGGISWETTDDVLKEHFGKYGTVVSSVIAKDRNSGVPRGFAFVTFSESSSVDRALQESHQILSRTVEVKRAIPRSEQQNQQFPHRGSSSRDHNRAANYCNSRINDQRFQTKKIFVGGLSASLTEDEFRRYFEKFGRINDVVVMHDNMTQRPRGFGFITFDSEDSVEEVMQTSFHELSGKLVEVKRAVPKDGNGGYHHNGRNSYQQVGYPIYNPRFVYFPNGGYHHPYGAHGPTGGFYAGISYGFSPVVDPRGFFSYGNAAAGSATPVYPPQYLNGGGGGGFIGFGFNGFEGKTGQPEARRDENVGILHRRNDDSID